MRKFVIAMLAMLSTSPLQAGIVSSFEWFDDNGVKTGYSFSIDEISGVAGYRTFSAVLTNTSDIQVPNSGPGTLNGPIIEAVYFGLEPTAAVGTDVLFSNIDPTTWTVGLASGNQVTFDYVGEGSTNGAGQGSDAIEPTATLSFTLALSEAYYTSAGYLLDDQLFAPFLESDDLNDSVPPGGGNGWGDDGNGNIVLGATGQVGVRMQAVNITVDDENLTSLKLLSDWDETATPGPEPGPATPEPSSFALWSLAGIVACCRRRRRE